VKRDKEHPRVLIEEWFPFQEVGIESRRERGMPSALPPVNYLHVWWARRPLIASKAAILASILPSTFEKINFFKLMKFSNDLTERFNKIKDAKKKGIRLKKSYSSERAFKLNITSTEKTLLFESIKNFWNKDIKMLDPMSGGGCIPFEGIRLGLEFLSSELNPVPIIIQNATYRYPILLGKNFNDKLTLIFNEFKISIVKKLKKFYYSTDRETTQEYIFSRVIKCSNPECNLNIPLSPNWNLVKNGSNITSILKLNYKKNSSNCTFSILNNPTSQNIKENKPTLSRGIGVCPRCENAINKDYINKEAQEGRMGHQMIAVVYQIFEGKRKSENLGLLLKKILIHIKTLKMN